MEKKQDAASKPKRGKAQQYADGGAPDPRMGIVNKQMLNFGSGASGSPYKKGGKAEAHSDVAMDKKLIKKMVKPGARTGKDDGGMIGALGGVLPALMASSDDKKVKQLLGGMSSGMKKGGRAKKYGGGALGGGAPEMVPPAMQSGMQQPMGMPSMQSGMQMPPMTPNMGESKPTGYRRGGKAKGKTHINIMINPGRGDQGGMPGGMPPGGPGGPPPGGIPIPMGGPPAPGGAPPMPMPMPNGQGNGFQPRRSGSLPRAVDWKGSAIRGEMRNTRGGALWRIPGRVISHIATLQRMVMWGRHRSVPSRLMAMGCMTWWVMSGSG
jgi:hypothetical protein